MANPVATFWCGSEMLRWIGEPAAADDVMAAVEKVCGQGRLTRDLGGECTTEQVTEAVVAALS